MPACVALLRGVNVGKAKRVPMAELRELLETLGFTEVVTLLNSGNVVFQAPRRSVDRLATEISAAIHGHFGFEVPVVVKTASDLDAIVAENPAWREGLDPARLLVAFTQTDAALAALAALQKLVVAPEVFAVGGHAAYLYCANGILESKAGEALLGKRGAPVTTRNWATTLKLQALLGRVGRAEG